MSWLTDLIYKKKEKESANCAKNRLHVVLFQDRENRGGPDFLPQLKLDIINAIKKYVQISDEQVQVNVSQKNETSMMEVSVSLDPKYDDKIPDCHDNLDDEDLSNIKGLDEK
jgi:cell division topological specificity factor